MQISEFKTLFLPLHSKLYKVAYRISKNEDTAKDLVQDTYVKLWKRREELKELKNGEAFAMIVLKNTCFDYLRKRSEETNIELGKHQSPQLTPYEQVEERDQLSLVEKIVEDLPQMQKKIMQLKYWKDYSEQEIVEELGVLPINIRVTLSRARKKIVEKFSRLS